MNITLRQNSHVINLNVVSANMGKLMEAIFEFNHLNKDVTIEVNQEPAYQGTVNPEPAVKPIKYKAVYAGKIHNVAPKSVEAVKYLRDIVPSMDLNKALNFVQIPKAQHLGDFPEDEAGDIVGKLRSFDLNAWTDEC